MPAVAARASSALVASTLPISSPAWSSMSHGTEGGATERAASRIWSAVTSRYRVYAVPRWSVRARRTFVTTACT
ncbi:hypothetical protein LUR56_37995 [Streptomyces sp. MT29]|nr:hypothetical protein [Streptomyces sp. MT29]